MTLDDVPGLRCVICGADTAGGIRRVHVPGVRSRRHARRGLRLRRHRRDGRRLPLRPTMTSPCGATGRCCPSATRPSSRPSPSAAPPPTTPLVSPKPSGSAGCGSRTRAASRRRRSRTGPAAMAVVKAQELGAEIITTASTGNAAAALAGVCASVGQRNVIFVPKSAPEAKIAQLLAYGSTVVLVDGNYDDAFELCMRGSRPYGWYNRNTGINPYMTRGQEDGVARDLRAARLGGPRCRVRERRRRLHHRRRPQGPEGPDGARLDRPDAPDLRRPGGRQRLPGAGVRERRGRGHQAAHLGRHGRRLASAPTCPATG